MDHLNSKNSRAEGGSSTHVCQFYSEYKDRLTLLERIEDLECFAVPNLRAEYEQQVILARMGQGNPKKARALKEELQAAEQHMSILKTRLKAIENCN